MRTAVFQNELRRVPEPDKCTILRNSLNSEIDCTEYGITITGSA